MTLSKGQRILTGLMGQLVHERLDSKHIGISAQCAHGGGPQRRHRQAVVEHLQMRHLVGRHGIALSPAARCQRWVDGQRQRRCVGAFTGGQQGRREGAAWARAVAIGPQLVMPVGDLARRVAPSLEHHTLCRTQRAVRQLVGARPQHAHRLAGAAQGHQHSIKSDIVSAVVAIAAGALDVVNQDVGFGHRHGFFSERLDDIVAQIVNALAVRPDLQLTAVPLRQCA